MENPVASGFVLLVRVLTGVVAQWKGCAPDPTPRVYFANHTSHLDALVIWSSLPPELRETTRPVAARDYWDRNALRRYLAQNVFRAVLIDRTLPRGAHASIQAMSDALDRGQSLILFPEGTRGNGTEIGTFRSGLFHLAQAHPELDLVPVLLQNLNRVLPKGEFLPVPLLGSATFGKPMRLSPDEAKPEFLERARRTVSAMRDPR